jgi:threonine dehydrogenase-like Zn-dependent dehydrogenase
MKALKLQGIEQFAVVDVDIPESGADQVLVRTGATTICTSDLNDLHANPFHIRLPMIMGHEGAGTVAAVGSGVRGFKVGDRVAAHPVHPCGRCAVCLSGLPHLCPEMMHFGLSLPGTMAEYFLVRADRARVLPPGTDFSLAALVEPICVCLEALAQARLPAGGKLLILGDGPFGLIMARLAQTMDLALVVVAGWEDFRLGFARGAVTINTSRDAHAAQTLRAVSGGTRHDAASLGTLSGYDAAILAAASPQAVSDGMDCLKPRGRLVIFASLHGGTPVDLFAVQMKELEIVGSVNDADRFDEAVRLVAEGRPIFTDLVTHRYAIDDYRAAFDMAGTGQNRAIKVAFVF